MFKLEQALIVLARHKADVVIIGGVAAGLHGSAYATFDLAAKRAAGRPKNLLTLPELEALREASRDSS